MPAETRDYKKLDKRDLIKCLHVINRCHKIKDVDDFHELIMDFASYIGFRFVLYCYSSATYYSGYKINIINLSNPEEWMQEYYEKDFLSFDPVRKEMERRLRANSRLSFILWDTYEIDLLPQEQEVVDRRRAYGLEYGCSVYDDSENRDFAFLVSFSDKKHKPDEKTELMCRLVVNHMMTTRKRLDMLMLYRSLTKKESEIAEWLVKGKTNWEIAKIIGISENTVKFHLKNIFVKLNVTNRQQAVNVVLIAKYLSN
ncbi:LuxR C-terminal-related transcriptional regulator [Seleniivibrio sp.]|uniref:LuxR C-terminal-related transcriptional regulator n=1 Tax=Seleniivibrio sp. TaxID=2898801 RepID=UPI0025E7742C|nr:LuxR C-terminal-related transcriptional regulator [Seleniivibrio sp.]MCD8553240.1 LuxR C-terminal-related transcriptional regulator [Seleniivibrio sp.]